MNNQSEQINELASALSKAQGEIRSAVEDKINPHFKSRYASLNAIWDACRDPLSKNGLAVIQTTQQEGEQLILITTLMHSGGQWIKSILPVTTTKCTAQALGSALTYMRRYSLASIVGVTSNEDDDANTIQNEQKNNVQTQRSEQPKKQEIPTNVINNFYKLYFAIYGQDFNDYLQLIEKKSGMGPTKIAEAAINNEKAFVERIEKWIKEKTPANPVLAEDVDSKKACEDPRAQL